MLEETYKAPSWHACSRLSGGRKVVRDTSLNENKLIYHFLPWMYARLIFQQSRLRLSPVMSWKDPYEKAWCQLLFQRQNRLSGVSAYGLCWTKSSDDEPLWRMNAFQRCAPLVRLSCRVQGLVNAGRALIESEAGSLYIGNVKYRREEFLRGIAKSALDRKYKDVSPTACGLLLQKRNAFRFESEVRLLWLDRAAPRDDMYLPIDTSTTIIQVMTSPYATEEEHEIIRENLAPYGVCPVQSDILGRPKFEE